MPSSQFSLAQLIEQQQTQNQLLAQQLALLQQQSQAASVTTYNDPQDLLKQVDPTLQLELSE